MARAPLLLISASSSSPWPRGAAHAAQAVDDAWAWHLRADGVSPRDSAVTHQPSEQYRFEYILPETAYFYARQLS